MAYTGWFRVWRNANGSFPHGLGLVRQSLELPDGSVAVECDLSETEYTDILRGRWWEELPLEAKVADLSKDKGDVVRGLLPSGQVADGDTLMSVLRRYRAALGIPPHKLRIQHRS